MDLGWADKWDARDEDTLPAAVRVTVEGLPFFGGAAVGARDPLDHHGDWAGAPTSSRSLRQQDEDDDDEADRRHATADIATTTDDEPDGPEADE